ncbi:MAG: hypothetical protein CME06_08305 [Gemmatimonadetes bacterium]|nr:hypothetical protein [Gemmatimonadota bacterium]
MPSDNRQEAALAALTGPLTHFRSCLAATVEEIRDQTTMHSDNGAVGGDDLGRFGVDHIDPERFALLISQRTSVDHEATLRIQRAAGVLSGLVEKESDLFVTQIGPNQSLRDAVDRAFADAGCAFGAARFIERLRNEPNVEEGAGELERFPFYLWNRKERRIAPPLVVNLEGAALRADELVGFMDGRAKIVLLVHGEAPPASLVRLITPGTFVAQTTDGEVLRRFGEFEGPGVVAWLPGGAAVFTHDPHGGAQLSERLRVDAIPEERPHRRLGGRSIRQQTEDLRQLHALVAGLHEQPAPVRVPETSEPAESRVDAPAGQGAEAKSSGEAPAEVSPVQELAKWILSRTDLSGMP